ncbi:MAG TPA: hypothetical protein VFB38_23015 [Chthonomonadaceae bacterium]|nr:hypothetical protein [Chthonomonadaceae bacterium]
MNKLAARLAHFASAVALTGVLLCSNVTASRAELQGVGSPGLPPPPPKTTCQFAPVIIDDNFVIYGDGLFVTPDGSYLDLFSDERDDQEAFSLDSLFGGRFGGQSWYVQYGY